VGAASPPFSSKTASPMPTSGLRHAHPACKKFHCPFNNISQGFTVLFHLKVHFSFRPSSVCCVTTEVHPFLSVPYGNGDHADSCRNETPLRRGRRGLQPPRHLGQPGRACRECREQARRRETRKVCGGGSTEHMTVCFD